MSTENRKQLLYSVSLIIHQKSDTCVHFYMFSMALPILNDIFENTYYRSFHCPECSVAITPASNKEITKYGLYATHVGNIAQFEWFLSSGFGNLIQNKYTSAGINTSHEIYKQFLSFKIFLKSRSKFKIVTLFSKYDSSVKRIGQIVHVFRGGSLSTRTSTLCKYSYKTLRHKKLLSLWEIDDILYTCFILPYYPERRNKNHVEKKS